MGVYKPLLADAKIPEDVPEDFVGGDFADDGADVVEGFADVLGQKVGGEGIIQSFADADEGIAGVGECLVVAGIGDEGGVGVGEKVAAGVGKGRL